MLKVRCLIPAVALMVFVCGTVSAQSTEFTYQGSLKDGANAANGSYDFEFALFDALSVGNQIGSTLSKNAVNVSNGTFAVKLDFGNVFPGASRYLEIRVRVAGQQGITTLGPRQLVNSAPYSLKSLSADNATTATSATNFSGSLNGDVTGTQGATVVSTIGGQSSANVAGAVASTNAATASNTASAIVKRDASGNFSAGTITGNLNGNATTATTATNATNAANTTNFSGNLAGDVTGTQAATVVSNVGGQSAANVANAVASTNTATSNNNANTIVKRDASGNFFAATITASLNGNALTATSASTATTATNATQLGGIAANQYVTGTSTTNTIPLWTGNKVLGNSVITQLAGFGRIGINTASPSTTLEVTAGSNGNETALKATSFLFFGVHGVSNSNTAVLGESTGGIGVNGTSLLNYGVYGVSSGSYGVYGKSTDSYAGYFQGNVYVTGTVTQNSDLRLKMGVASLNYGLPQLMRLRPVSWDWKQSSNDGRQLGLIAQEVETILPELVKTAKDADQTKGINYIGLVPVLVKAVQEQQAQIQSQQKQIARLVSSNAALNARVRTVERDLHKKHASRHHA